jgi:hypothetical protein
MKSPIVNFKFYTKSLLISLSMFFVTMIGIILYLDPLQIFHQAPFGKDVFLRDEVKQNAGIINNYEFDSIILGSSDLENTSSKQASELLNSDFVNLSISASLLSDRAVILDYTLKNKEIKKVIMSLDGFAEFGKYKRLEGFFYLYNNSDLDDIKVYSNPKYFLVAGCQIARKYVGFCNNKLKNIEDRLEWFTNKIYSATFGGIDNWLKNSDSDQISHTLKFIIENDKCIKNKNCKSKRGSYGFIYAKESFDNYILKYAENNLQTSFHLVFPPYSRLRYAMWSQANPEMFEAYIEAIKYIVGKAESMENIFIYGFDHLEFVNDISNYKDAGHYHQDMNSMMLRDIRDARNTLTNNTVDFYIEKVKLSAKKYDISPIANQIKEYLDSKNKD